MSFAEKIVAKLENLGYQLNIKGNTRVSVTDGNSSSVEIFVDNLERFPTEIDIVFSEEKHGSLLSTIQTSSKKTGIMRWV